MESRTPPLWLTRPPEQPLHLPANRTKNAFAAFWHTLSCDAKSPQIGWQDALNIFRDVARHSLVAPHLPIDHSTDAATAFANNLRSALSQYKWNLSDTYLKSSLSRAVGFGNWPRMAFVLSLYRDFAAGKWELNGVRLTKPLYSDAALVLPGSTVQRYNTISGRYFRVFESAGAWYTAEFLNGCALIGYRRGWGYSIDDCIAWKSAQHLASIGPRAWNSYYRIPAGTSINAQTGKKFTRAEEYMIRWTEQESKSVIRTRFLAL